VQEVAKHTDHVDILFANAGASWGSEFDKVDEKNGWDKVMDVNIKGVFFTIQKFVFLVSIHHYIRTYDLTLDSRPSSPKTPRSRIPRA
jgi:NAD(P)-dependent dehydrogenase (short-subunit alcohol dehydrogenase family)